MQSARQCQDSRDGHDLPEDYYLPLELGLGVLVNV
jgi:hypothetical protein